MVSSLLGHIHYDIVFACLYIKSLRVPGVYERFHLVICHAAVHCEVFQKVFTILTRLIFLEISFSPILRNFLSKPWRFFITKFILIYFYFYLTFHKNKLTQITSKRPSFNFATSFKIEYRSTWLLQKISVQILNQYKINMNFAVAF